MQSPTTITIITSPAAVVTPLPPAGPSSPTIGKQAPLQYRIEERQRTVYFTSDQHPSQLDPQSIAQILKLADIAEAPEAHSPAPSVHRTRTNSYESQIFVINEDGPNKTLQPPSSPPPNNSRFSSYYPLKSSSNIDRLKSPMSSPESPKRSPRSSPIRPRILFYHKHDPHYGFTNFSPHPVHYKGKKYPTSEHLFQSFKVGFFRRY